jgi:glucose-fructose oxidoreductase
LNFERRNLLLLAAASAVAPEMLLRSASAQPLAAPGGRKLGYAIVGLGSYGLGVIIPEFARCQNSRLAAVVTGDAAKGARVAAEHGLPASAVYS